MRLMLSVQVLRALSISCPTEFQSIIFYTGSKIHSDNCVSRICILITLKLLWQIIKQYALQISHLVQPLCSLNIWKKHLEKNAKQSIYQAEKFTCTNILHVYTFVYSSFEAVYKDHNVNTVLNIRSLTI